MISGGTAQSMVAAASGEDPSSITDPAALIADAGTAAEIRRRSPISLMPRRNSHGAVIASMAPSAFINPAVIHRTAALLAAESGRGQPFRYREGVALGGFAASLPLRYAGAGALAGVQAALGRVTRAQPSVRRRVGRRVRARSSRRRATARRPTASKRGGGACPSKPAPPEDTRSGSR